MSLPKCGHCGNGLPASFEVCASCARPNPLYEEPTIGRGTIRGNQIVLRYIGKVEKMFDTTVTVSMVGENQEIEVPDYNVFTNKGNRYERKRINSRKMVMQASCPFCGKEMHSPYNGHDRQFHRVEIYKCEDKHQITVSSNEEAELLGWY